MVSKDEKEWGRRRENVYDVRWRKREGKHGGGDGSRMIPPLRGSRTT